MTDQLIDPGTERAARRVSLRPAQPASPGAAPRLDLATLADIALGLGRVEDLWRPYVSHDPLSRTSVRMVATEAYEVWLLGWTAAQRVELHDHGGARAAFVVLEGELDELTLGPTGVTRERLGPGSVGTVEAGVVHDVVNAGRDNATSLHVYSAPLETMTFYDLDGRPRFTEVVEQVPALVTSAEQTRALHPASRTR